MYLNEVSMYRDVPFRKKRKAVPDKEKRSYTGMYSVHFSIYRYMTQKVCTRYIIFASSMYSVHTSIV